MFFNEKQQQDPGTVFTDTILNPLPEMPILDSSSLTGNKDMMAKMWINGDVDIL